MHIASRPGDMAWLDLAHCRDLDPDLFFPPSEGITAQRMVAEALRVCSECSVTAECLEAAWAVRDVNGIRGGMTGQQRRLALRSRDATLGSASAPRPKDATPQLCTSLPGLVRDQRCGSVIKDDPTGTQLCVDA